MLRPWTAYRHLRRGLDTLSSITKTKKADGNTSQMFVDFRRVVAEAGGGGDGCVAFLRLFANAKGGPSGGDGGNGGHVVIQASSQVHDLSHVGSIVRAKNGARGQGSFCHGANADHTIVPVPVGTLVSDEHGQPLSDLCREGDLYIGARGGGGGKGNAFFLSNTLRAPALAERGANGEQRRLRLELKVLATTGLVGFPNAGKSSLLRAVSRARPRVANFAFTTLRPHIGVVEHPTEPLRRLTVADIPGLVLGAHQDRGLGFSFLRHIERCRFLVFVLDIAVPSGAPQPLLQGGLQQLRALRAELELYQAGLSTKPSLVVANKADLLSKDDLPAVLGNLQAEARLPVIATSAKLGTNIDCLVNHLFELDTT